MSHSDLPPEVVIAERSLFAQMRRAASRGDVRVGWKVGHAIAEVDALGTDLPALGWISSRTVLSNGDVYRARDGRALRGETEVVIELARAVEPGADADTVRDSVAGLRVALEIVDVTRPPRDAHGIIVGNLFHRAVVFGARRSALTTVAGRATLAINGRTHHQDEEPRCPISLLRDIARMLAACGERLAPGDRILTGSLVHVPVAPGDHVRAEIENLGHAGARIDS